MKNIITSFSAAIVLLVSCSPATEKKAEKTDAVTEAADIVSKSAPEKKTISKAEIPADFSALVPIDVLDTKSTDAYQKYGIEFSGNCYSCDLAGVSITKDKMIWTNICDEKDAFEVNGFTVSGEDHKIILKTSERTYILARIDKAPVYELTIEGQKLDLNNKRVARYFTTKKALPLFKEHECGEFEG